MFLEKFIYNDITFFCCWEVWCLFDPMVKNILEKMCKQSWKSMFLFDHQETELVQKRLKSGCRFVPVSVSKPITKLKSSPPSIVPRLSTTIAAAPKPTPNKPTVFVSQPAVLPTPTQPTKVRERGNGGIWYGTRGAKWQGKRSCCILPYCLWVRRPASSSLSLFVTKWGSRIYLEERFDLESPYFTGTALPTCPTFALDMTSVAT